MRLFKNLRCKNGKNLNLSRGGGNGTEVGVIGLDDCFDVACGERYESTKKSIFLIWKNWRSSKLGWGRKERIISGLNVLDLKCLCDSR